MSNYRVEVFKPSDLVDIDMREHERETINIDNLMFQMCLPNSQCGTMFANDGTIICLVGICELWNGVFQVFVIPSRDMRKYGVGVVRQVRRLLDSIQISHKAHRMQSWSLDDTQTNKWMETLGFTCEGKMLYFTNNKHDYNMWARYGDTSNGR